MASRKEQQEEKKLAKQELTKICKAVLIDRYFYYVEEATQNGGFPPYDRPSKILLKVKASKSQTLEGHVQVNSYSNRGLPGNQQVRHDITSREVALLDTFFKKYDFDTRKLFSNNEVIFLALRRQPTEEEKSWAESVFINNGVTSSIGHRTVTTRFAVEIKLDHVVKNETAEQAESSAIERTKALQNQYVAGTCVSEPTNIRVLQQKVTQGLHQLKWWTMDDDPKQITDI